jgi:hypothetical protein
MSVSDVIALCTLAVTIIGAIATITSIDKSWLKVVLLCSLAIIGFGAIVFLLSRVGERSGAVDNLHSQFTTLPTDSPGPVIVISAHPSPNPSPRPTPIPSPSPPPGSPSPGPINVNQNTRIVLPPYEPGDMGRTRNNGYYELTLDNTKASYSPKNCFSGFVEVQNDQELVAVTFSLRALSLQVPSIATTQDVHAYYILGPEQRNYEMICGDGRYFNVELNSFQGKPKAKTLTVEFLVPRSAHNLRFRFNPGVGNPILFDLPNPI